MKKYTKTYLEYFDYPIDPDSYIPCEVCKDRANDIHHLEARGSGFKEKRGVNDWKNEIGNLMALCRTCHTIAETDKEFNEKCKYIHNHYVKIKRVEI